MTTITRRGFIGTAAAAMATLVPSWRQFKQRRQIDLTPFCTDSTYARYHMTTPFAQDGQAYATDGRVCVRTTLADAPALGDEVRLPPASRLPWWASNERWRPYPKQQWRSYGTSGNTCPMCAGRGGVAGLVRCIACDGELSETKEYYGRGEDEFTCPQCPTCRGTGWTATVWCDYCGGKGKTNRPTIQAIEGVCFAGQYDHKIRALGELEYVVIRGDGGLSGGDTVLAFRGDGFDGLLMPMVVSPGELRA